MRPAENLESLVEELIGVLDNDIEHIAASLASLNDLRAGIIRRDERNLESLLSSVQNRQNTYAMNEARRETLRRRIAGCIEMPHARVTISVVIQYLDGALGGELLDRKTTLDRLVARLKSEYAATLSLLSQCSRFNKKLLNAIVVARSKGTPTYNASGSAKSCGSESMVNMRF